MLKIVQRSRDSWLNLVGGSQLASRQKLHTCQACQKLKHHASWSTIGQKVQFVHSITLWLELAAQSSCEAKPPASFVLEKLTLRIPNTHKYKYPLYPRNVESFQREFWERNLKEKQAWFISNLHIETLQIPLLPPSLLLHPWEVHYQNLFSPYSYIWKDCLVLWEAVRKGPISYWLILWSVAESGKLKKK